MEEKCIFCKIANKEIPSERIYENDNFFSIYDQDQSIKGHALVISKRHFKDSLNFPLSPQSISKDFLDCIQETAKKLMEKHNSKGFNVVGNNGKVAGQLIDHFHFHILPRKEGDRIKLV